MIIPASTRNWWEHGQSLARLDALALLQLIYKNNLDDSYMNYSSVVSDSEDDSTDGNIDGQSYDLSYESMFHTMQWNLWPRIFEV